MGAFSCSTTIIGGHGNFSVSGLGRRNHDFLRRNIMMVDASLDLRARLVKQDRRDTQISRETAHSSIKIGLLRPDGKHLGKVQSPHAELIR